MPVPVDLYVKDTLPSPAAISGVFVSVLNPTTFAVIATATTDVDGRAAFSLPGVVTPGTTYEVRFYKLGVRFTNPQQIRVVDPPITTNKFDMSGTLLTLPAATDPRLCRCSGRFMSFSNTPISGAVVRFMAMADSGFQVPKVVDGNLVSAEALALETDEDGYITVDLFRSAEYYITFSGEDDVVWNIKVPDRASVNLIDLIHPQPVLLTWDDEDAPGNAVSVAVGETKIVHYTITFSDYEELTEGTAQWIDVTNSDDEKMDVGYANGTVTITGIAAGTAEVTVAIKDDLKPVRVPDYSITAPDLTVTVTP